MVMATNDNMKKILIATSLLFSIAAAFYIGRFYQLLTTEEMSASLASTSSEVVVEDTTEDEVAPAQESMSEETESSFKERLAETSLVLHNVSDGDSIQSPLILSGTIDGPWFFEGSATVEVQDTEGHVLGQAITTAESLWMDKALDNEPVAFTATVLFAQHLVDEGFLVFKNANASGLAEHDHDIRIPVRISPQEQPASLQLGNIESDMLLTSPARIEGNAVGWYHEGEFSAEIEDLLGNVIGSGRMIAQDDWMSYEFVPFLGNVTFTAPAGDSGYLVLRSENPGAGLGMGDIKEYRIPVRFK